MSNIYDEAIEELTEENNESSNTLENRIPNVFRALERAKKVEELLGLCLKFIEGLNITIETTTDESDTYDYEYLEIGFAKCELLPIFKQIQALEEELK